MNEGLVGLGSALTLRPLVKSEKRMMSLSGLSGSSTPIASLQTMLAAVWERASNTDSADCVSK
jgi:hypothetical protein